MPRRVEDILPNDRRSIRSIPVDKASERKRKPVSEPEEVEEVPIRRSGKPSSPSRSRMRVTPPPDAPRPRRRASKVARARKIGIGAFLGVVILVAGTAYVASTYFSHATFTIVPVTIPVTVNSTTIVATGTSTPGYVHYQVVAFNGAASTTIAASDGTYISTKASGSVTIYNSYSSQAQRLIAGTRFAGSNGLVYRLTSSVVIPGSAAAGPGDVRATLVADQPGSDYDAAPSDSGTLLHIIAYQGGPRYDTIYARSFSGMSGGFTGTKKIVDPTLLASTTADMQAALTTSLLAQAMASVPDGFVSYPTAYGASFAPADVSGTDPNKAVVTVSGTLYSVIFKKDGLAAKLAGQDSIDRFGGQPYAIDGLESLSFVVSNPSTFKPSKGNTLIARLSGSFTLKGIVPIADLTQKLAGLPLASTRAVFSSYGSVIDISKSSGELFPSWAGAVPTDKNRITIQLRDP